MKPIKIRCIQTGLSGLDELDVEALVLAPFKDEKPLKGAAGFCDWRLNGRISSQLASGWFSAKPREVLMMDTCGRIGSPWVVLFGQGTRFAMDLTNFQRSIKRMLEALKKAGLDSYAIELPGIEPGPLSAPQAISAFFEEAAETHPKADVALLTPNPRFVEFVQEVAKGDRRIEF